MDGSRFVLLSRRRDRYITYKSYRTISIITRNNPVAPAHDSLETTVHIAQLQVLTPTGVVRGTQFEDCALSSPQISRLPEPKHASGLPQIAKGLWNKHYLTVLNLTRNLCGAHYMQLLTNTCRYCRTNLGSAELSESR